MFDIIYMKVFQNSKKLNSIWKRSFKWLKRRPVTSKIAGSSPVVSVFKILLTFNIFNFIYSDCVF